MVAAAWRRLAAARVALNRDWRAVNQLYTRSQFDSPHHNTRAVRCALSLLRGTRTTL